MPISPSAGSRNSRQTRGLQCSEHTEAERGCARHTAQVPHPLLSRVECGWEAQGRSRTREPRRHPFPSHPSVQPQTWRPVWVQEGRGAFILYILPRMELSVRRMPPDEQQGLLTTVYAHRSTTSTKTENIPVSPGSSLVALCRRSRPPPTPHNGPLKFSFPYLSLPPPSPLLLRQ